MDRGDDRPPLDHGAAAPDLASARHTRLLAFPVRTGPAGRCSPPATRVAEVRRGRLPRRTASAVGPHQLARNRRPRRVRPWRRNDSARATCRRPAVRVRSRPGGQNRLARHALSPVGLNWMIRARELSDQPLPIPVDRQVHGMENSRFGPSRARALDPGQRPPRS